MLKHSTIEKYISEYHPQWACPMSEGYLPTDIMVAFEHQFYRLTQLSGSYSSDDFKTYYETDSQRSWGDMLPLALGLSLIDNENKARKNLKLPLFRRYKGIVALTLNPCDGVVKQTGVHHSHFTWWRTITFQMSNLKMLHV